MSEISLEGLSKAAVLAALYNSSKPQGMGFLQFNPTPMTQEEAAKLLEQQSYFDYLQGRVMKIDLSGETLNPWGYDRDNGQGAVQRVIDELRAGGSVKSPAMQGTHAVNTQLAANEVMAGFGRSKTTFKEEGKNAVLRLGFDDMEEHLRPAVEKVTAQSRKK